MRVNAAKSMCIRFGHRFDAPCVERMSIHGDTLKWVSTYRYLGVYFTSRRTFRCSYDCAKSSFFRAFNAIYSEVGCTASEETVILPCFVPNVCLYSYMLQKLALWLTLDLSSLEFTTTRVFMKIFCISSSAIIAECQHNFNFLSVQRQLTIRTAKFLQAFAASDNYLCSLFESVAVSQLNRILTSFSVKSTSHLVNR